MTLPSTPATPTSVRIALLGGATLQRADVAQPIRLERKTAALIAYLALESQSSRSRLAGLLWPHAAEPTARNNLAQAIKRLHDRTGGLPVVEGRDHLRLTYAAGIDARDLLQAERIGERAVLAEARGELLAGIDYGDCEAFARWLGAWRERLRRLRCNALADLADSASSAGQPRVALNYLSKLVAADPLSEAAHRRLMQVHASLGDLAAAEAAYERCRKLLWQELGVPPSIETRTLHDEIQAGLARPLVLPERPTRRPPHALFRPPLLVGRDAALARMQSAWDAHQAIFVTGEAGIGKTRLMQEFMADKGRYYLFEGLPQDHGTPYATYSRTLRQALQAFPGLRLPDWVVAEAARLLPELGGGAFPVEENDRLRFFHALAEANDLAVRAGMRQVVVDDLQCVDLASLELGHFVYARQWGRPDGMRSLMLARRDEMSAAGVQAMDWVLERGYGIEVRLEPLDETQTGELLAGIEPAWRTWASALHRHTGGNPGMMLETLRLLYAEDGLSHGLPESLPVPEKAAQGIERRLARLSAEALRLARLAAMSERGLDVAQAASLLACPAAALLDPWTELERAGVLRDGQPAHGCLRRVLLAGIPEPLRRYLQMQIERM